MTTIPTAGQKPHVIAAAKVIAQKWPQIPVIGGFRPGDPQDHGKGLALDVMVNMRAQYAQGAELQTGNEIAAWAQANARQLGVQYVIWQNKIWNIDRDSEGWRSQGKKGATFAHYDHVHISFKPSGGSTAGLVDGDPSSLGGGDGGGIFGAAGQILGLLTNSQTWWRIVWAVAGFAMILFALIKMTGVL